MSINFNIEFETDNLFIRPLELADYDSMQELTSDPEMWIYLDKDLSNKWELKNWILSSINDPSKIVYSIISKDDKKIIGSISIYNVDTLYNTAEIGFAWVAKPYQGKGINREATMTILQFLFEECGFKRVEFKINVLNTTARFALFKIGLVEEGISGCTEMTMQPEEDKIIFSILKAEWETIKQQYNNALQI